MNLRHLKLWKRHAATSDVTGDVGRSRDAVDVRSPSSDSGYSDVAPPSSSMFSRGQHGQHGHRLGHRGAEHRDRDRDRGRSTTAEVPGRRKTDVPAAATGHFRGLRGTSTPRSADDSTRRALSPPSADLKTSSAQKATSTLSGAVTVDAFFSVVREGNVDKLRQFLRDTKFDVNARDSVRQSTQSVSYVSLCSK